MNKVIKNILGLTFLTLGIALSFTACKKEVQPELILTVKNERGQTLRNVKIAIFASELDESLLDPILLDSGVTDAAGVFRKKFVNTVIIDVAAFRVNQMGDTTQYAMETFKIEEKRQKSKENFVRETLILPN
tara:strand:+ start:3749 stop:4144 length:396 start_codon:yes stop_codon:yes gene_type:complete